MTGTANTFVALRRVHAGLIEWFHEILQEAGAVDVQVHTRFVAEDHGEPNLVVIPHQVRPWPKVPEGQEEVTLMSTSAERKLAVPDPWVKLGQQFSSAITSLFTAPDARPRARPGFAVAALPAPLAAWYTARHRPDGVTWAFDGPDGLTALPPSLGWRRAIPLEARYLVLASDHLLPALPGEGVGVGFGLPALASVFLGVHEGRLLSVRLPAVDMSDDLRSFTIALAASIDAESGERMRQLLAELGEERSVRLAVTPVAELPLTELAPLLQARNRSSGLVNMFSVQIMAGGGPVFSPSGTAVVQTAHTPR